ncbi:Rsp5p-dependent ubiquitination, sorting of cargo proteins at the multivesicular body [Boothiomyces macroporosus]|uniref:Rsp5p-dependent ubiquitination, sorting of cargo proteins at the multivesicular body n=1 Tax=Boothiomyces macroporosus TaxID=261099 RepID=A0AAD5UFX2_9FUNG|nr:Rsp5p-dependent ubiquitination, sorting of cargo proteins at the multivesicular body [Boothiomyces macroporosus]
MTVDQFNITGNYTSASWQNATIYAGNISLTFSSLNQQQKDSNDWWLSTQNGFHNTWTNVFIIVGAVFFFSLIWVYAYIKYRKNPYIPPPPPPEMTEDEILQRADSFLVTYPPDTESTLLVLKTVNILPTSMENANSPSFLLIRQFEDFPIKKPSAVEISAMTDSQTIEFIGNTECSIQTNTPLKPHDLSISAPIPPPSFVSTPNTIILEQCYYEIKIIQLEPKTTFAFGFAACPYPPFRLPGYDEHSIGYFSSTGRVHLNNRGNGVGCGLPLIQGDTVGIGYRIIHLPKIRDHELIETVFYFTHNGVRIGDEFVGDGFFPDRIYPTIGATGNCTVQVTFGDPDAVFYPLPVEEITDTIDQANVHAPEQPDDIEMTNLQSTINECSIEMD